MIKLIFSLLALGYVPPEPSSIRYPEYNHCYIDRIVCATVRINDIYNNYRGGAARNTVIKYTVLSVSPFDTSIYANAQSVHHAFGVHWIDTNNFRYDTAGFPRHFTDSMSVQNPDFVKGDTLRNVFLLTSDCDSGQSFWSLCRRDSIFLRQSNPPFPLQQALSFFNDYLNRNHVYKGNLPPANGILKLGPVFKLGLYDGDPPAWMLSANNDTSHWYFEHWAGGGGRGTLWSVTIYKVDKDGTVLSLGCEGMNCPQTPVINVRDRNFRELNEGSGAIYDISGRKIGVIPFSCDKNRTKASARLALKPGLYFIGFTNQEKQRTIRMTRIVR